ncbi:MAG: dTMP kinase [Candidatus Cloacimonetes bacterium]|nr:dTMP kinase [Candidatus Cloacimonadota bacterium]
MIYWYFMLAVCFLMPLIMIGFGAYFKKGKPEEINIAFGYRSSMSMKNLDTWKFAHIYCGHLWYWLGLILLPLSLIAMLFVFGKDDNAVGKMAGIVTVAQTVPMLGTIYFVEKALRRRFNKDGSFNTDNHLRPINHSLSYLLRTNYFITFEGIEGSGKTTQVNLLKEALESCGYEVFVTREPGGPVISEKIRDILLDPENKEMTSETELLLYLASRNQHTVQWIIPALTKDQIVICDRYSDSTIAYQGAARKLDLEMIKKINFFATRGIKPDMTFILDIPIETFQERLKGKKLDRIETESLEFHNDVRKAFLEISQGKEQHFVLDGRAEAQKIHKKIKKILANYLVKLRDDETEQEEK